MSKKMCNASTKLLTLLIAILLYTEANAGTLRAFATTTTTTTFLSKDIDEQLLTTTTTVPSETTENAAEDTTTIMALSRDEGGKKNPNLDAEVLKIVTHKSANIDADSSKLLLSVPKTTEKSKEPAENIEEPKEITEMTNQDDQLQTTTMLTTEQNDDDDEIITTTTRTVEYMHDLASGSGQSESESESESQQQESEEEESEEEEDLVVKEMIMNAHVDNAAREVLEADIHNDYIVVDDDNNHHLEPYVHSIEIVPAKLEGLLLEDFVHNW